MAIKVQFEIGHSSNLKSKPTSEGFTHDWEVFVSGVDKSNISEYVEKVVFNLHESFRKPKRTVKEPPYVLKESGYAGFQLSIEIYFKNRNEPRKVIFFYDLDLNQTKPYQRSEKKDFIFENPSEDFRHMLKNGGGVVVVAGNTVGSDKSRANVGNTLTDDRNQFIGKPKINTDSQCPVKKVKPKTDDHFTNLFGTPITKSSSKVSPEPTSEKNGKKEKVSPVQSKLSTTKDQKSSSGSVLLDVPKEKNKKDKHKHSSPHKERDSTSIKYEKRGDERSEKKKDKSHSKERGKSREKLSRERLPSPLQNQQSRSSSATNRDEINSVKSCKISISSSSKKSKKEKKDKDRERSDRREKDKRDKDESSKQHLQQQVVSTSACTPTIPASSETPTSNHSSSSKSNNTPIINRRIEKLSPTSKEHIKNSAALHTNSKMIPSEKDEKDKRHKHKKKDKTREKDSITNSKSTSIGGTKDHTHYSKEKKKERKLDKPQTEALRQKSLKVTPPVNDREDEAINVHNSDNSNSSCLEIIKMYNSKDNADSPAVSAPPTQKKEKKQKNLEMSLAGLTSTSYKDQSDSKIKRRRESIALNNFVEPPSKQIKKDEKILKNGHEKTPGDEANVFRSPAPAIPTHSTTSHAVAPDYMVELQELHHKIMTLQDNKELQHVVELIAETGNYEITSRTFDFDLCKLDRVTVQRLQDFFATSPV